MQQVSDVIYCGCFGRVVAIGGESPDRVMVRLVNAPKVYLFSIKKTLKDAPDLRRRLMDAMRIDRYYDDVDEAEILHGSH